VDWIDLAQDRNRWRALVNSVSVIITCKENYIHMHSITAIQFSSRTVWQISTSGLYSKVPDQIKLRENVN
jgi:hypothetical protein